MEAVMGMAYEEVIIFGDIEAAIITHLRAALLARSDTATVAEDGEKPSSATPRADRLVTVQRLGGGRQGLVTDAATVTFRCYDTTYPAALQLVNLVRGIIGALRGEVLSGILVHRVEEFAAPARLPHPVSNNPRYTYTASIHFRGAAEA